MSSEITVTQRAVVAALPSVPIAHRRTTNTLLETTTAIAQLVTLLKLEASASNENLLARIRDNQNVQSAIERADSFLSELSAKDGELRKMKREILAGHYNPTGIQRETWITAVDTFLYNISDSIRTGIKAARRCKPRPEPIDEAKIVTDTITKLEASEKRIRNFYIDLQVLNERFNMRRYI